MRRSPALAGVLAYGLWALLPLYIHAIDGASAAEMVAHRVIWSFVLCASMVFALGRLDEVMTVAKQPRQLALVTLAALLIGANWGLFIWGASEDRLVDVALGYFINPLISVAIGIFVLGERPRSLQYVALAASVVAVGVLTVDVGHLPYLSLGLALTFAAYGFVKKTVAVGPVAGMTVEAGVLLPFALGGLIVWWASGDLAFLAGPWEQTLLLIGLGVVTAVPLLFFAAAASGLSLTELGLMQYLTPIGQFVIGTVVYAEHVGPLKWVGVALVWFAVVVVVVDLLRVASSPAGTRSDQARRTGAVGTVRE